MYEVCVADSFVAQHYLTVPNPGPEGELHSHQYAVAVSAGTTELNEFGYVIDIDDFSAVIGDITHSFQDSILNDREEFTGVNPSLEHLARVIGEQVSSHPLFDQEGLHHLEITIEEDDVASVTHKRPLP